jgi:signal peptidase I
MKHPKFYIILISVPTLIVACLINWRLYNHPTSSMTPTIPENSKLITQRYWTSKPHRDDLIVFETGEIKGYMAPEKNFHFIMRLIGLPGEKIKIINGKVYIDDKLYETNLEYIEAKDKNALLNVKNPELTVPQNHYFVLGDNTHNSLDSRYYGFIHRNSIISKAVHIIK